MAAEGARIRVRRATTRDVDAVATLWIALTEHHAARDDHYAVRPGATAEIRGLLLASLRDDDAALLIIDATSMTEVARVPLPQRVPYGVHACWIGTDQLEAIGANAPGWTKL